MTIGSAMTAERGQRDTAVAGMGRLPGDFEQKVPGVTPLRGRFVTASVQRLLSREAD